MLHKVQLELCVLEQCACWKGQDPWIHSGALGQSQSLENWAGGLGALVQIRKYLMCNWGRFYTAHTVEQSPHIRENFHKG